QYCGSNRYLSSFPTRRSSDLHADPVRMRKGRTRMGMLQMMRGCTALLFVGFVLGAVAIPPAFAQPKQQQPTPAAGEEQSGPQPRSEEHTSELQSLAYLVCRLL